MADEIESVAGNPRLVQLGSRVDFLRLQALLESTFQKNVEAAECGGKITGENRESVLSYLQAQKDRWLGVLRQCVRFAEDDAVRPAAPETCPPEVSSDGSVGPLPPCTSDAPPPVDDETLQLEREVAAAAAAVAEAARTVPALLKDRLADHHSALRPCDVNVPSVADETVRAVLLLIAGDAEGRPVTAELSVRPVELSVRPVESMPAGASREDAGKLADGTTTTTTKPTTTTTTTLNEDRAGVSGSGGEQAEEEDEEEELVAPEQMKEDLSGAAARIPALRAHAEAVAARLTDIVAAASAEAMRPPPNTVEKVLRGPMATEGARVGGGKRALEGDAPAGDATRRCLAAML